MGNATRSCLGLCDMDAETRKVDPPVVNDNITPSRVICPKCNGVSEIDSLNYINHDQNIINGEHRVICKKCNKSSPWKYYVWTKDSMPDFPAGTNTTYIPFKKQTNIPYKIKPIIHRVKIEDVKKKKLKPVVKVKELNKNIVKCPKCNKIIDTQNLVWSSIGPNLAYHDSKCSNLIEFKKVLKPENKIVQETNTNIFTKQFLNFYNKYDIIIFVCLSFFIICKIYKHLKKDLKTMFERRFSKNPVEKKFAGLTYSLTTDQYVNLKFYFKSMGKDLTSAVNFLQSCRGIAFLEEFGKSTKKLNPTEISKMIIDAERNEQILECVVDILEDYSVEDKISK